MAEQIVLGRDVVGGLLQEVSVGATSPTTGSATPAVAATGTLTVSSYAAIVVATAAAGSAAFTGQPADGNTITINGTVFTFKTTPVAQRHVQIGASATLTAQAFKAAVNAFLTSVVASGAGTTITLTAAAAGIAGNSFTLSRVGANITVTGFSGGLAADTIQVGSGVFTFVSGTPANAFQIQKGSSNSDAASKIATAVGAAAVRYASHVSAAPASAVVTFTALETGTLGNSLSLVAANVTAFALVAFAGGVNPVPAAAHYALLSKSLDGVNGYTAKYAKVNVAASQTDSAFVAAVATKKIRVIGLVTLAGGTATTVVFNSKGAGAGVAISPVFAQGVNGGVNLSYNPAGWFETVAGEALTVTTGAGSTTGIVLIYIEV